MPGSRTIVVSIAAGAFVAGAALGSAVTAWVTRGATPRSATVASATRGLDVNIAPRVGNGEVAPSAPPPGPAAVEPPARAAASEPPRQMVAGEPPVRAAAGESPTRVAETPPPRAPSTGVVINERELSSRQVAELVAIYRFPPPRGRFWYDPHSGLYGVWGREAAGYIRPGHSFGPLAAQASGGHTGVFINGRQINDVELAFLQKIFGGQVRQGRAWLDGTTWNIGVEGDPRPIANLAVAVQQAQQVSGGKHWGWRDGSGATMSSDGNCTMMAVPGAPVYSSGC
jgi:hypothetical protein